MALRTDSALGRSLAEGRGSRMIDDQYAWLVWASAFLISWLILVVGFPQHRRPMLWARAFSLP